jgi:hypothetical protein
MGVIESVAGWVRKGRPDRLMTDATRLTVPPPTALSLLEKALFPVGLGVTWGA